MFQPSQTDPVPAGLIPTRSKRVGTKIRMWAYAACLVASSCIGGDETIPSDGAKTTLPISQGAEGAWEMLGYHQGDTVPDITLYSGEGQPFHLYAELHKGKPVMIINGSYTCDISRGNLPSINALSERVGKNIEVVMVYTIDAHPNDMMSPYSPDSDIWIPPNNIRDSISAQQPKTYGERVELSKAWIKENQIHVPVVIDKPDNEYWMEFGQAPNMCYIIDADGVVEYRQTWFDEKKLEEKIKHITE